MAKPGLGAQDELCHPLLSGSNWQKADRLAQWCAERGRSLLQLVGTVGWPLAAEDLAAIDRL
ncbi:MAG: hypothetical protein A2V78_10840 [Betaproteobacteria bacterium RBG_16_64_18]|nr:MAG: hypothetical protein A2V78_10840 [Betaproteobacteria bacterium RBG_16_64_18]OGA40275.1 MAG: hypothetical protein A3G26_12725 [Betaproteobacteria bacterium RIFCSPLOWO2_12_FULL_65_110]